MPSDFHAKLKQVVSNFPPDKSAEWIQGFYSAMGAVIDYYMAADDRVGAWATLASSEPTGPEPVDYQHGYHEGRSIAYGLMMRSNAHCPARAQDGWIREAVTDAVELLTEEEMIRAVYFLMGHSARVFVEA